VNWYIERLIGIILRPIFFFQDMPGGSWQEDSLSFALVTGWILSFILTFVIFVNSYIPTGLSLIEGIYGKRLIIVLPVLLIMGFVFFAMSLLIIAGIMIIAIIALFMVCAAILNFLLVLLGGTGNVFEVIKASFYATAAVLAGVINILSMILVKYKVMSIENWITGERVIFYLTSVFLYGMFSIIGRKTHKVSRAKAFLAATIPFILLVLFNIVFSAKVLPKVASILG